MSENKIEFLNDKYDWNRCSLEKFIEEGNLPSNDWKNFFEKKEVRSELKKISSLLESETDQIYPELNKVLRPFYTTPLKKIKVVILGQDPYHNGSAVGLCFSVKPGNFINPSLRNIYYELKNSGYKIGKRGDISHWAKQGCFLLNTALTVRKGQADTHTNYWFNFSELVINYISKNTNAVWLLMGSKALNFSRYIEKGDILVTSHPSPFSASSGFREYEAFLGSKIFRKVNDLLEKKGKEKIIW